LFIVILLDDRESAGFAPEAAEKDLIFGSLFGKLGKSLTRGGGPRWLRNWDQLLINAVVLSLYEAQMSASGILSQRF